ncbi:thioredoxin family protein [Bacteroidota bacterium]
MKRLQLFTLGIILALAIDLYSYQVYAQDQINWHSIEEVQNLAKNEPRMVFVDVYTDWCGWCKKMDATTFKDPKIIKQLNKNFYAVKLDGEGLETITFKDKPYKFVPQGRKGYHELAAVLMNGKMSYPTTVYLDEGLNLIQPIAGYMTVESLEPILIFLGEAHYKNKTWEEFLAQNYTQN